MNNERVNRMTNLKERALIAAVATIALTGCGLIKPRDAGYFRFHAEEARLVVTRCERGQETGSDCEAAAQAVGTRALIVMPADSPKVKVEGVRSFGGEVRFYDRWSESREAIGADPVLKVIVESAALLEFGDADLLTEVCTRSVKGGATFVKTSTGFHPSGGASAEAVALMRAAVGPDVGVKASGGIRSAEAAQEMIDAGASRLGLSGSRAVLAGFPE